MKRLPLLLPLAVLCACSHEVAVEDEVEMPLSVYNAVFENFDTKLYADPSLHLLWNEDDRVTIFPQTTRNKEYRFLGRDGAATGSFEEVPSGDYGTADPIAHHIAIYPYAASNECNTDEDIVLNFPSQQSWRANSFGPGAAYLLACSETQDLSFKHLGGYLAIQLTGEGRSISSIQLKGNNGETLSGRMVVRFEEGLPCGTFDTEGVFDSITLTAAEPVVLGAEPVIFWMAVPCISLPNGFTVTITGSDGWEETKSTYKSFEFVRGRLHRMEAFAFTPHPTAPGIYHQGQEPILFPRLTTMANVYEAEGNLWSRYLIPATLSVYQLGPIPAGIAVEDEFDAVYTVIQDGAEIGNANVTLEVVALGGGYAVLLSKEQSYFIVRI